MNQSSKQGGTIAATLLLAAALTACSGGIGDSHSTIHLANPGPAVETVNGEEVPQRLLEAFARSRNWDLSRPELRERALKEVTNYVLAAQAARDNKFMDDPDFAALVEVTRLQAVMTATVAQFQKDGPLDEAAMRAEYDKQVGKTASTDYDFSQIVFRDEADAKKAAAEIAGGKTFEKVSDAHKKDALQTRTFQHVRASQMPESLAKALEGMKVGEASTTPVQTPLGWHVVHLEAVMPHTPPAFEQVKDSLRRTMLKRAGEDRMMKLRADAKIVPASPPPAHATAPATPAAPAKPAADDAKKPQN
jgi:peptidyl-prolyl cis-trans isomerase C